jgi:hypothetical protein
LDRSDLKCVGRGGNSCPQVASEGPLDVMKKVNRNKEIPGAVQRLNYDMTCP